MDRGIDAVLVLAGGAGRRLGGPKAGLDWDGRPLLLHVLARLAPLGGIRIVAAAAGQALPAGDYHRVDDRRAGAGPLAGLAAGLEAIAARRPGARVAVSACDYPFADPGLFQALAAAGDEAVVLPRWGGHQHPLQAVWSADLGPACAAALAAGQRRVSAVIDRAGARIVDGSDLGPAIRPAQALLNLNAPTDWDRARALGG